MLKCTAILVKDASIVKDGVDSNLSRPDTETDGAGPGRATTPNVYAAYR